jgi:phosphonate transport system substrate-binding protein
MAVYRVVTAVFFLIALILGACEKEKEPQKIQRASLQQELLIGLIPEQNVFRQRERYMVLRQYLSDRLGIVVNFTSLSRYGNIIERFSSEKMDGAFFGSFTYALAHNQLGVEPIARSVNLDGTSTYHGYIFVRSDAGIRTVDDMKGKRFVFVDRATTAGYLFPLAWFREKGIDNLRAFLGDEYFAGSHDAAIQAVLSKEADVGAAKNTIYDQLATENPRVRKELVILAASDVVPQNCLAVRKDLDPELKTALRQILLTMDKDNEGEDALRRFGARGFIETNDHDYDYLYRLSAEVGINLKTYRYRNE